MSWYDEEVSTDTVNPDQLDRGTCRKAGRYHVELLAVKPDEDKSTGGEILRFDFQILAGTEQSEVGNVFYHREKAPNGEERRIFYLTKLAVQLGVVTKEEVGPGKALPIRKLFDAEGRQYVIDVTSSKSKDGEKTYVNLGHVYDVNDPKVEDVPKDIEALESAGTKPKAVAEASSGDAADFEDL